MTDQELLKLFRFIPDSDCGKGGFRVKLIPPKGVYHLFYDEERIIIDIDGEYVNPIGPFKRWVIISGSIISKDCIYSLFYKKEFREECSEYDFREYYLPSFLAILREIVYSHISVYKVASVYPGYKSREEPLTNEKKKAWSYLPIFHE